MATSAPSWASPQTSGQVRRSQALADTIREMQQGRTPDSYRTASATNYNILADAILGYAGANAEKKANEALTADRTRIADMIRGSFPDQRGLEAQQLNADQAFDLTPGANDQRKQQGGIGNLASMIFETTGDPAAALNAGLGQQRQAIEDERYGRQEAREDKKLAFEMGKPVVANAGDRGFVDADGDGQYDEVFNVPAAPGSQPGGRVQSTFIDKDGTLNLVMGDGTVVNKGIQARGGVGTVDVGGVPYMYDRYQGGSAPVTTPQTVGQNQATVKDITTRGEAQTKAALDLPQAIATMENNISAIDQLITHPKIASRYGWRGVAPPLPGEESAAQALIDQVKGAAFLQAFESLKGGGQITEVEGKKATQAMTRLENQWQDWDSAKKAAEELKQLAENGLLRAKAKAGQLDYSALTDEQLRVLATK